MFVELIYDKRNLKDILESNDLILDELTKRVHRTFPAADVKVKPMQANGINTDDSKSDKAVLTRLVEEMFNDANEWLVTKN